MYKLIDFHNQNLKPDPMPERNLKNIHLSLSSSTPSAMILSYLPRKASHFSNLPMHRQRLRSRSVTWLRPRHSRLWLRLQTAWLWPWFGTGDASCGNRRAAQRRFRIAGRYRALADAPLKARRSLRLSASHIRGGLWRAFRDPRASR
jgi:hypothetical protein